MKKKLGLEKLNKIKRCDSALVILVTILTMFGVVMVFSASYYSAINSTGSPFSFLWKQGFFAVSGFIIMMVMSLFDYHKLRRFAVPIAIIEIVLLLLIFTPLGVTINNARRWIRIGITIMPGELAKPAIILLASAYFSANIKRARSIKGLFPIVAYTIFVCLMIVKQPNLSTSITVFLISAGIAFVSGMHWGYIGAMGGGLTLGSMYLAFFSTGYQHDRVVSFLDPFKYSLEGGFQVVQSLLALGTGSLRGIGLGNSVQKNLYLPEPQNDFILAIIGEELGFVGIAVLLTIFAVVIWKIFCIALNSKDRFGMLLASGVAMMIGFQVILNVAVVTSSMPPTGVALPFISYGGNALWIFMGLIGIVLNISRQQKEAD
ncbi:MAG: putative peptidoglycan glycosyltransferase FtsW [Eubacterium sp.]|nr:putative peptidoglycan glycosyltransferase FtsW [Eubacterium sp.]